MKKNNVLFLFVILQFVFISTAHARIDTTWVRRYDNRSPASDTDYARAITVDDSGYIYVTGGSKKNGTDYDFLTIKYKPDGDTVWARRDGTMDNDYANAIAVDNAGNVFVTGYCSGVGYDFMTIKYNKSGGRQWTQTYNYSSGDDVASAIAVDASGNVYVTGYSYSSGSNDDYATIKYSTAGVLRWVKRYDGPGNIVDRANAITLRADTVYVTGESYGSGTSYDYATIKYNPIDDTVYAAWVQRYNYNSGTQEDKATAIAVDASGNVYVTGGSQSSTGYDYATVKYYATGSQHWAQRYSNSSNTDFATAIKIDGSYIYVTGYSWNNSGNYDYYTRKYNSSGTTIWSQRYDGSAHGDDQASAIAVDATGDVYVTGYSTNGTGADYTTVKYWSNSPTGYQLWVTGYNGPGNSTDKATGIAVNGSGNIYVTGASIGSGTDFDYATIRYTPVRDVGVDSILQPQGILDSTATMTPRVRIRNYGSEVENFNTTFKIGSWLDTIAISNLPPDSARIVNFDPWTVGPRGNYVTRCSTGLAVDAARNNDTIPGSFTIVVRDISTVAIIEPAGDFDSVATIIPKAKVKNFSTQSETFNVRFSILGGPAPWTDDTLITLNAADSLTINFDPWTTKRGNYTAKCSTALARDSVPTNDKKELSFRVKVHDVGATEIIYPTGTIDSTAILTPQVKIKNFGSELETFDATFTILGTGYSDTQLVADLISGEERTVPFSSWVVSVGSYTTKCSTELWNDMIPANDKKPGSFTIVVHDVSTLGILDPSGTLDSTAQIIPRARIKNNGTQIETFNAKFSIGTGWSNIKPITLNSGQEDTLEFDPWTVQRGDYATKCSTELVTDIIRSNDRQQGSISIIVHDVGATEIIQPVGVLDSTDFIIPQVKVKNYGTQNETFTTTFTITGLKWSSTKLVSDLGPNNECIVVFDPWPVARGNYATKCSTELATDMVLTNDNINGSFSIILDDVGVTEIIQPNGLLDSTATVTPQARIKNFGTEMETFNVTFKIGAWSNTKPVTTLAGGEERVIDFDPWTIGPRGTYSTKCSTELAIDLIPENDKLESSFDVRVRDFAVTAITSPAGEPIDSGLTITPKAWIHNYGIINEVDVPVTMYIGGTSYSSTKLVSLNVGDSVEQTFNDFITDIPRGNYTMRCTTQLTGDVFMLNNLCTAPLIIFVPGWQIRDSIPVTPFGKGIKSGSALTAVDDTIYAFQGGNSINFFAYFPSTDSWANRCSIPYALKPDSTRIHKKKVKSGGSLVSNNGIIYGFKGNSTYEFWSYFPGGDSWVQKRSIPEYALGSTKATKVKAGAALTTLADSIYAFKGGNRDEFWMYDIPNDTWYQKRSLITPNGKRIKAGAALVAQGCTIYAFVGGNTNYFYAYDITQDTWIQKADVYFGTLRSLKRKVKDGSGLVEKDGRIFALKGGNTQDFGYYSINSDTWFTLDTIPRGDGRKRVKGGGAMIMVGSRIYALKGSNTVEFWKYSPSTLLPLTVRPLTHIPVMVERVGIVPKPIFDVVPNPFTDHTVIRYTVPVSGKVTIKLYNVNGEMIKTITDNNHEAGNYTIRLMANGFAKGVYFLKYKDAAKQSQMKLIIN